MTKDYTNYMIDKNLDENVRAIGEANGDILHANKLPDDAIVPDYYAYYAVDQKQADWYNGYASIDAAFDNFLAEREEEDKDDLIERCQDFGNDYEGRRVWMELIVTQNAS